MKKLTPAIKKAITRDWQGVAPQFFAFQPMRLARRIGPLIQGICLDGDSSNASYLPTLHVHCLCRPFPVVSLSLGQPLLSARSGTPERIQVQMHEEKFQDACERLITSSLLPAYGDWTVNDVLNAYDRYRAFQRPDARYPVSLMEDAVSICAWLGEAKMALTLASKYAEEAQHWPENVLHRNGGFTRWRDTLQELASSADGLRATVEDQAEFLKLQNVPASQLVRSPLK